MCFRAFLISASLALTTLSTANADDAGLAWQFRLEPSTAKAGDDAELVFAATIPEGFIVYSSDFKGELGPRPAKLVVDANDAIEVKGPLAAVQAKRRTDKTFGTEYSYFEGHAEFRQKVRLLKQGATISGRIDGQTCQEKDGLCALFKAPFSIAL